MKISSWYSVFETKNMEGLLDRFAKSGALTPEHHFSNETFDYYVMKDASGNSTDFIQFKNGTTGDNSTDSFFGIRINTDDFDAMSKIICGNGYALSGGVINTPVSKIGILDPVNGSSPRVLLFQHVKKAL